MDFLARLRVQKGDEFTHTSIVRPSASYYVPVDLSDEFFERYEAALEAGEDLFLTERHREVSPVLIDLDFRWDIDATASASASTSSAVSPTHQPLQRRYSRDDVEAFVKAYCDALAEFVELPNGRCRVFVMEKPGPAPYKGMLKDGLHMVAPDVVTPPAVQHLVRRRVLEPGAFVERLQSIGVKNAPGDVLDEAVIDRNNWQMYGSKKPDSPPYAVTVVYEYDASATLSVVPPEAWLDENEDVSLVRKLSIRNKVDEAAVRPDKVGDVQKLSDLIEQRRTQKLARAALQSQPNARQNTCAEVDLVTKLVDCLQARRAENYNDWIRVGWCLRNIDHRLLDAWDDFSKKSPKYAAGECASLWPYMRDDGLGMGTLHMWAKADDEEKYRAVIAADLYSLINASMSETHHDVARVVFHMYRWQYVCSSIKHRRWYEFKNHRWIECDGAYTLRRHISEDVTREYEKVFKRLEMQKMQAQMAAQSEELAAMERGDRPSSSNTGGGGRGRGGRGAQNNAPPEFDEMGEKIKKLRALVEKCKTVPYKENVIREAVDMFYDSTFEDKLDSKHELIGFDNGVFDLDAFEFRPGRPDDYMTFTTGYDYVDFDPTHPRVLEIKRFFTQVFTCEPLREYVLTLLASWLHGSVREERFHFFLGVGSNSKSVCMDLLHKAVGQYFVAFPVAMLTQKRLASNAANSELSSAKGRRFAVLQEPGEAERLNVGLMKEMTGGDVLVTRQLYAQCTTWVPQFKLVMTCNHLPAVPADDHGTWRRIRVVDFTSKFTERPDPNNPREFPIDYGLSTRMGTWKEHFMGLLLHVYYLRYRTHGLREPDEVMTATREYQRSSDFVMDFSNDELEKAPENPNAFVSANDVFDAFKAWARSEGMNDRSAMRKKELQKTLERILGKPSKAHGALGWKGWRLRNEQGGGGAFAGDDVDF
jgi:P4 family phage/plasmid primase-like protien